MHYILKVAILNWTLGIDPPIKVDQRKIKMEVLNDSPWNIGSSNSNVKMQQGSLGAGFLDAIDYRPSYNSGQIFKMLILTTATAKR